uniref:Uncharacterized protein n=1 Tax=Virus NIOZ-UU157 TaxID=2763269 RepID=A0A7S9SUP3_9VIRU|nr:MAG: hypothetical protein NIOZUU157_00262 [Virus NIOZ-UU157]
MATLRKLVSDVRSTHKILSTDALITDRAIASEVKNNALVLIKRETNLRRLWASDTLFTTIPCLEMVEVPISECCEYADPCTVARTKFKLPRISEGNYQYVIQGVYSINAMGGKGKKLKEITVNRYLNTLKLRIIKKESYFWISNGYLYVSNPLLKSIRLVALFEEDVPNEIMYPDCECGTDYSLEDLCKNPLDKEYAIPGYLEQQALAMTSTKLLSTYFQIKTDMSNEGIDGQASNAQPTN